MSDQMIKVKKGNKMMDARLLRFPSIAALAAKYQGLAEDEVFQDAATSEMRATSKSEGFYGRSFSDTAAMLKGGDVKGVSASDKIMSMMDTIDFETTTHKVVSSVSGGAINIGAIMAGHPLTMRQRRRVMDEIGPVCIVVDATVSSAVTSDEIRRRGAAVMALVRIVSQSRPVSLHLVAGLRVEGHTTLFDLQIDTAPMDLARGAAVMVGPEFLRRCCFSFGEQTSIREGGENGAGTKEWAFGSHGWAIENLPELIKKWNGAETAVTVPGFASYGNHSDFDTNESAAEWVQSTARKLLAQDMERAA